MRKHNEDGLRKILERVPLYNLEEPTTIERIETGEVTLGIPDLFLALHFYPCWVELKQLEVNAATSKIKIPFRSRQFIFLKSCAERRNPAFVFMEVRIKAENKGYFVLISAEKIKIEYANFSALKESSAVIADNNKENSADLTWLVTALKKEREGYFNELLCKIRPGQL